MSKRLVILAVLACFSAGAASDEPDMYENKEKACNDAHCDAELETGSAMVQMGKRSVEHLLSTKKEDGEDEGLQAGKGGIDGQRASVLQKDIANLASMAEAFRKVTDPKAQLDTLLGSLRSAFNVPEFSFLAGDAQGIRYSFSSSPGPAGVQPMQPSVVTSPQPVFSAGKWTVAASLGAAIIQGHFAWTDPVNKYIEWWTTDPSDKRSLITFEHCLSHTSGLITATTFHETLGYLGDDHAYVGLWNEEYTAEECARMIYNATDPNGGPSGGARYGDSHYVVAQFAAMQATGMATWQEFFAKYWAEPLGLHGEVVDNSMLFTGSAFTSDSADAYTYGFAPFSSLSGGDRPTDNDARVSNPDGGAQLVISPCAYSRFLTTYLQDGESIYGRSFIDAQKGVDTSFGFAYGNYSLGHWIIQSSIHHSTGAEGVVPLVSTTPNGNEFWFYANELDSSGGTPEVFLGIVLPQLMQLMMNPPDVDPQVCP